MPKKIRSLTNVRYSIEIETEFPDQKDSQKLIEKHRIIRGWALDYDGSLENGAEYRPKDRNKLYWNEDSIDQIKEIIGLIKAHKGDIRSTCGLHVHVDMKDFTYKEIAHIIKAYIKDQRKICKEFKMLKCRTDYAQNIPKSVSRYLTESNIKKVKQGELEYGEGGCEYLTERHYSLNMDALNKHGTLEFRLFNGSIQIRRIKKYVKWCLNYCIKNATGKR